MDDEPDSLAGYRSPIHGRRPIVRAHPDRETEYGQLAEGRTVARRRGRTGQTYS